MKSLKGKELEECYSFSRENSWNDWWFKYNDLFKDHEVTVVENTKNLIHIKFAIGDDWWKRMEFTFLKENAILIITGDFYDATYRLWGRKSIYQCAITDYEYFSEKCSASEKGRFYYNWDGQGVYNEIKEALLYWEIINEENIDMIMDLIDTHYDLAEITEQDFKMDYNNNLYCIVNKLLNEETEEEFETIDEFISKLGEWQFDEPPVDYEICDGDYYVPSNHLKIHLTALLIVIATLKKNGVEA